MFETSTSPNLPGTWRFNFLGFPVAVQWVFWLIAALLGGGLHANTPYRFQLLLIWIAVMFVSILVHELGHALAFRKYGGRPRILLWGMGGLAIDQGRYRRNDNIVITLAGPAFGLALGLVVFLIARLIYPADTGGLRAAYGHFPAFLKMMIQINIFWSLINLLPIYPLDGGQLLGHIMHERKRELRAKIGMGCAIAAGLGLSMARGGSLFILIMFGYLAYTNYQMARPQWR